MLLSILTRYFKKSRRYLSPRMPLHSSSSLHCCRCWRDSGLGRNKTGERSSTHPFYHLLLGREKNQSKRESRMGEQGVASFSRNVEEEVEKEEARRTPLNLSFTNRHGNLKTAPTDRHLKDLLHHIKTSKIPAVINYGASWCRVCSQILPPFCQLSNEFPKLSFVYADIDECPETTQNIRYTPTFHFFRDGERVDEMLGAGEERLHDRLWLHS